MWWTTAHIPNWPLGSICRTEPNSTGFEDETDAKTSTHRRQVRPCSLNPNRPPATTKIGFKQDPESHDTENVQDIIPNC